LSDRLQFSQKTAPDDNKSNEKLELTMLYETYTARQAAEITPGSDAMVPSATEGRHLQRARSI